MLDRDHHLDDDGGDSAPGDLAAEPGLELFVWGLRHIESYLLVPSAIRLASQYPPPLRETPEGQEATMEASGPVGFMPTLVVMP